MRSLVRRSHHGHAPLKSMTMASAPAMSFISAAALQKHRRSIPIPVFASRQLLIERKTNRCVSIAGGGEGGAPRRNSVQKTPSIPDFRSRYYEAPYVPFSWHVRVILAAWARLTGSVPRHRRRSRIWPMNAVTIVGAALKKWETVRVYFAVRLWLYRLRLSRLP